MSNFSLISFLIYTKFFLISYLPTLILIHTVKDKILLLCLYGQWRSVEGPKGSMRLQIMILLLDYLIISNKIAEFFKIFLISKLHLALSFIKKIFISFSTL